MENFKDLCEFIKIEYPKDSKDLSEALDLVVLALDSAYDSIAKTLNSSIISQKLEQISILAPKLEQIISVKKSVDDVAGLLTDTEALEDEIIAEEIEEAVEKREIPNYSEYAIDTSIPHSLYEDFTHTKACGFKLNDTVYEAKNMRGVIIRLCEILAEKDSNKIISFIDDPSMKGRKAPYFSNKLIIEDGINKNEQIGNLNVYVWVNLSCNQIRNVIKRILRKFDLSFESFKIFLRADFKELHKKDVSTTKRLIDNENEEKIGKYVQSCFEQLIEYKFTQNELTAMQNEDWTLSTFGFRIPLIKKCEENRPYSEQIKISGNNRYWKNPYTICGELYFVASQWQYYHRDRFNAWFDGLNLEVE